MHGALGTCRIWGWESRRTSQGSSGGYVGLAGDATVGRGVCQADGTAYAKGWGE